MKGTRVVMGRGRSWEADGRVGPRTELRATNMKDAQKYNMAASYL